jgi:hypothetical protein
MHAKPCIKPLVEKPVVGSLGGIYFRVLLRKAFGFGWLQSGGRLLMAEREARSDRPNVAWDEKIYQHTDEQESKTIHVFGC